MGAPAIVLFSRFRPLSLVDETALSSLVLVEVLGEGVAKIEPPVISFLFLKEDSSKAEIERKLKNVENVRQFGNFEFQL